MVGLGTMGAGIVEVFAREGLTVIGLEISEDALERGRGHLEGSTAKAAARGKLSPGDRDALLGRVTFTTSYDDLAVCDLVVEAVPELMKLKRAVFGELDRVCKPGAVLATNTSSLSVTEIAMTTSRPADVIGMHFFNPAPVMKLVEIVRSVRTDEAALAAVEQLTARLGKTAVVVTDRAGFVANYLLLGYLNRAVGMYATSDLGREELDAAVRLGIGLPMGPLELIDLIGLDTTVEILDTIHAQTGDPLHVPAPLLKQLVQVGALGRKAGRGFYDYAEPGAGAISEPAPAAAAPGRIGVAGDNPLAEGLAALLTDHGLTVARGGADPTSYTDCDIVVEALVTDLDSQRSFLVGLADAVDQATTVLIGGPRGDVSALAAASGLGGRLAVFHVLEPTKRGRLVEIAQGDDGDVAATHLAVVRSLAARLELTAVQVPLRAGYVVGGLLFPHINDAIRMVDSGYATVDDVDNALTLGCGYPFGLVAAADLLGLDRVLGMQEAIYDEERQPGLAPAPLLRRLVASGHLGRSTGRGFREVAGA